jgi:hypothetical protein
MVSFLAQANVAHQSKKLKTSSMKPLLPLLSSLIVLASCTTAYKSGQTPDDVYFSPARPQKEQEEYVQVERDEDEGPRYRRREDTRREQDDYYTYNDDRYLRMKIRNRDRWAYLDDYYRDPYAYNYNSKYYYNQYGYSSARSYWNSYYNPYGGHVIIVDRGARTVNRPRTYNLHVFDTPTTTDNTNTSNKSRVTNRTVDRVNNNRARNNGSDLRTIFGGSDNSTNSSSKPSTTVNPPARTDNSSSSGSNSSSSGSTTAPRRKF